MRVIYTYTAKTTKICNAFCGYLHSQLVIINLIKHKMHWSRKSITEYKKHCTSRNCNDNSTVEIKEKGYLRNRILKNLPSYRREVIVVYRFLLCKFCSMLIFPKTYWLIHNVDA